VTTLGNISHSSNLAPVDFYLFLELKSALKERRICDATDIIKRSTEELKKLYEMPSRNVSNTFKVADRTGFY
jgi:hypothetical protein